jgi:hypothetical protein
MTKLDEAPIIYKIRIGSGEWADYSTPVRASKFVADSIYAGYFAEVQFENASSLTQVLDEFDARVNGWLRQLGHDTRVRGNPTEFGAIYELDRNHRGRSSK